MKSTKFTPAQLNDFRAYVRVQKSNRHNMLTPGAISATSLRPAGA